SHELNGVDESCLVADERTEVEGTALDLPLGDEVPESPYWANTEGILSVDGPVEVLVVVRAVAVVVINQGNAAVVGKVLQRVERGSPFLNQRLLADRNTERCAPGEEGGHDDQRSDLVARFAERHW